MRKVQQIISLEQKNKTSFKAESNRIPRDIKDNLEEVFWIG